MILDEELRDFTFYCSSIKGSDRAYLKTLDIALHSTVVLLKGQEPTNTVYWQQTLHSTVVLLKGHVGFNINRLATGFTFYCSSIKGPKRFVFRYL